MLEIKSLNACYGESIILRNVNMKVKKGQVVCLLGRNGVGKTTLLKSIMGLVNTPSGQILFNGNNIIKKPTYERAKMGIGYVPQGREIFPYLTVYENLLLGLEIKGGKGSIGENIYELFPVLRNMLNRKGGDLSGGQQQQLAIARALVSEPSLLILDEPTEGIQPSIIEDIAEVLRNLKQLRNITMLIVEQYMDFVMDLADYFYVMEKGCIIMEGSIDEINQDEIKEKITI